MSNFKVFIGNDHNQAQYVGQILDDVNIAKLDNVVYFPTQTGNAGKYLTTNGLNVSWSKVDALPSQISQAGKFLTTDGTSASWSNVELLPSQTGQSGKYLTTDGNSSFWANVDTLPDQTSQAGKFLITNGTTASWSNLPIDSETIIKDLSTNNLKASGTINHNNSSSASSCFNWIGTLQEYNDQQISTNHPEWICYIIDDVSGSDSVYTKAECDAKFIPTNNSITSIQVYANKSAAQAASIADSTKLCLYPAV